jgi:hypothetical protein
MKKVLFLAFAFVSNAAFAQTKTDSTKTAYLTPPEQCLLTPVEYYNYTLGVPTPAENMQRGVEIFRSAVVTPEQRIAALERKIDRLEEILLILLLEKATKEVVVPRATHPSNPPIVNPWDPTQTQTHYRKTPRNTGNW